MDTQQQILVEQRVANEAKSAPIAYLLWFFAGGIGAHRFYLGRPLSAIVLLGLTAIGVLTIVVAGIGLLPLAVAGIWLLVDLFLIPGMVQSHKETVRRRLTNQITHSGQISGQPALTPVAGAQPQLKSA